MAEAASTRRYTILGIRPNTDPEEFIAVGSAIGTSPDSALGDFLDEQGKADFAEYQVVTSRASVRLEPEPRSGFKVRRVK